MNKSILLAVFLFVGLGATAQKNAAGKSKKDSLHLIQLTGIVISDSMERIPFTKVYDANTGRGVICDYFGYFALVVQPGDTITFKSLGFKTKTFVIADTTSIQDISLVQILKFDTLMSDPVDVYPWPSREAFADAFVNMPSPNDDLKRARKRLTPQEMAFVGTLMESDGLSSYSAWQQQYYQEQYTRGQGPQNNLLNPASWADFIKGIGTGRYRISN